MVWVCVFAVRCVYIFWTTRFERKTRSVHGVCKWIIGGGREYYQLYSGGGAAERAMAAASYHQFCWVTPDLGFIIPAIINIRGPGAQLPPLAAEGAVIHACRLNTLFIYYWNINLPKWQPFLYFIFSHIFFMFVEWIKRSPNCLRPVCFKKLLSLSSCNECIKLHKNVSFKKTLTSKNP